MGGDFLQLPRLHDAHAGILAVGEGHERLRDGAGFDGLQPRGHEPAEAGGDALAEADLAAGAEEEGRADDGEAGVWEGAEGGLHFTFHAAVEHTRSRVGAEGADEEVVGGAVREAEAGGEEREVVVDVAEALLRLRDADGRAEGADDGVGGKGLGVMLHLGEVEHALVELRVSAAGGAAGDDGHALDRHIGEEELEDFAADQAGGAEEEDAAHHASPRAGVTGLRKKTRVKATAKKM